MARNRSIGSKSRCPMSFPPEPSTQNPSLASKGTFEKQQQQPQKVQQSGLTLPHGQDDGLLVQLAELLFIHDRLDR
eukprot:5210748-Amphidinium_carterae.1